MHQSKKSEYELISCCLSLLLPAAQHFEGFDPEGFSLCFCDYKYPEENTVNFIVMNKVSWCALLLKDCLCLVFNWPLYTAVSVEKDCPHRYLSSRHHPGVLLCAELTADKL